MHQSFFHRLTIGVVRVQDYREERRQRLMAVLAARFARVRGEMTDAEFGRLLADMVKVAERFVEIDAKPGARRPDEPVGRPYTDSM